MPTASAIPDHDLHLRNGLRFGPTCLLRMHGDKLQVWPQACEMPLRPLPRPNALRASFAAFKSFLCYGMFILSTWCCRKPDGLPSSPPAFRLPTPTIAPSRRAVSVDLLSRHLPLLVPDKNLRHALQGCRVGNQAMGVSQQASEPRSELVLLMHALKQTMNKRFFTGPAQFACARKLVRCGPEARAVVRQALPRLLPHRPEMPFPQAHGDAVDWRIEIPHYTPGLSSGLCQFDPDEVGRRDAGNDVGEGVQVNEKWGVCR